MGHHHYRSYVCYSVNSRSGIWYVYHSLLNDAFGVSTPLCLLRITGESEYWFALIKVIMIILFIIVGLIYDWGGVKGHPGPVSSNY